MRAERPSPSADWRVPERAELWSALVTALSSTVGSPVELIERGIAPGASSHVAEVVTVRMSDDSRLQVLCKYGGRFTWSEDHDNRSYGHRGGVDYEDRVFREVLARYPETAGDYCGSAPDPAGDHLWLFTRYRARAAWPGRGMDAANQAALVRAAEWSARFQHAHAAPASRLAGVLRAYDAAYLAGWSRRAAQHVRAGRLGAPWLASIREDDWIEAMLQLPPTVIHGEYYPANILVEGAAIHPVDWESTALAPGEIDLATLTAGWPSEAVLRCEEAYHAIRWPGRDPRETERALALARLYVGFRWLGDTMERAVRERSRLVPLRHQAEILGLIE